MSQFASENNGVRKAARPIALPGLLPPAPAAVKQHANLVSWIVARFGADAVQAEPFRPMLSQHYGFHSLVATRKYVILCDREANLAARVLTPKHSFADDLRAIQVAVERRSRSLVSPIFKSRWRYVLPRCRRRSTSHPSLRSALHVAYLMYGFFLDPQSERNGHWTATAGLNTLREYLGSQWFRLRMENVLPMLNPLYGSGNVKHLKRMHYEWLARTLCYNADIHESNVFSELDNLLARCLQDEVKSFASKEQLAAIETDARGHLKRYASIVESDFGVKPSVWLPAKAKKRPGKPNPVAAHAARTLASRISSRLLASRELLHDLV